MPIELKMPALSPTMEEGTLARWLVKEGDSVSSGDLIAEIETDKATMEFEAVDEGVISKIMVAEGTDGVKVGTVIALSTGEDEDAAPVKPAAAPVAKAAAPAPKVEVASPPPTPAPVSAPVSAASADERIKASPLAKRLAAERGIDLATLTGTGPGGRIVKEDVDAAGSGTASAVQATASQAPGAAAAPVATA
ncbi:MAG: biotin/lipoyl-containing protein, partial [Sphingomonadales bacterium]